MKREWFFFHLDYMFRAFGAMPIDRKGSIRMVDYVVELFKEQHDFVFSISPEGTRSYVEKWKTGFYYIAKGANIPVVMVAFGFNNKEIKISDPYYLTDNI